MEHRHQEIQSNSHHPLLLIPLILIDSNIHFEESSQFHHFLQISLLFEVYYLPKFSCTRTDISPTKENELDIQVIY